MVGTRIVHYQLAHLAGTTSPPSSSPLMPARRLLSLPVPRLVPTPTREYRCCCCCSCDVVDDPPDRGLLVPLKPAGGRKPTKAKPRASVRSSEPRNRQGNRIGPMGGLMDRDCVRNQLVCSELTAAASSPREKKKAPTLGSTLQKKTFRQLEGRIPPPVKGSLTLGDFLKVRRTKGQNTTS